MAYDRGESSEQGMMIGLAHDCAETSCFLLLPFPSQIREVPVSAVQRNDACERVLWAFRKGQLGKLMLDFPERKKT